MAVGLETSSQLNEQQVLMLRLLKTPLPDEDFNEMRSLAVKLLSKNMDDLITNWEDEKMLDAESYERLSIGHFRSKS